MDTTYQITTISGPFQNYVKVRASIEDHSGERRIIIGDNKDLTYARQAHRMFASTGLSSSIRNSEFQIVNELRLVYEAFPERSSNQIIRVYPLSEEKIHLLDYQFKDSKLQVIGPIEDNFSDNSLSWQFQGLEVYISRENIEKDLEAYYGRDLKKTIGLISKE